MSGMPASKDSMINPEEEQTALRIFIAALIFSALVLAIVLHVLAGCASGTIGVCNAAFLSGASKEPRSQITRDAFY